MTSVAPDAYRFDLDTMIAEIELLVCCESPTADRDAVQRSAAVVERLGTVYLDAAAERLTVDGVTHLRWRLGDPGAEPVLLLGHHDTVWPLDTLERLPWSVTDTGDGAVLRGPGVFDMKTGLVQMFHAARAARRQNPQLALTVLVTSDEEIGSPSSRALIEGEARGARAALILEASADGGAVKHARKGVSMYRVHAHGRAAHAGLEPERGVNATVEMAHQVLQITDLNDTEAGTTVTATASRSGTTSNTVPAEAVVEVDVRAWTAREQDRVDAAMHALRPVLPDARVSVDGGPNRPPLEDVSSQELVITAQRIHWALGLGPLATAAVGGASDGNFTAGVGCPTLDGLGAVGGGAHADDEHVLVRFLEDRTALLAALVQELGR